ncbi:hypothetical protein ACFE04_021993 [Oxalis oulophora]
MFSLSDLPQSASLLFSAYASLAACHMFFRSIFDELIPNELRLKLISFIRYLFGCPIANFTLVFDDKYCISRNEVYEAAEMYLRAKISPKVKRLKISQTIRQKQFAVSVDNGEEISDKFEDISLKWRLVSVKSEDDDDSGQKRSFELTFDKKYKDKVIDSYIPYVLEKANEIKQQQKIIKLYCCDCRDDDADEDSDYDEYDRGEWGSIDMEHPSTFETLALDQELKEMIMSDLDMFVRRKEFYKKTGKPWKRGYLLYGPPGTGKSSLIAAMANYLKFDVYDLEFSSIHCDSDLRETLLSTTNRSILVIEDIDSNIPDYEDKNTESSLSGLMNMIDGLWSSCGDERIIVFTTNHKDRLDPALLRPGRMDMHINLSYCTAGGLKILASNYLGDSSKSHPLFGEIEELIGKVEVTPAQVAEELMKSDDVGFAFEGLIKFLKQKKAERVSRNGLEFPESKRLVTGSVEEVE